MNKGLFYRLLLTTLCLCLSQVPYLAVWIYGSPMPFDGFFSFTPYFLRQVISLYELLNLYSVYTDFAPGLVMPPYESAGILRLLLTIILGSDLTTHAIIQAVHGGGLVLSCAVLFRSFRAPWSCCLLGGLMFSFAGVNLSLVQHVAAYEALLYFVLSLYFIRLFLVADRLFLSNLARAFILACLTISLISLGWYYHDLIHFFLPICGWTLGHLYFSGLARKTIVGSILMLTVCGIASLIAIIPTIMCAWEMSFINKTQVTGFGEGLAYSIPMLLAGLVFPASVGGLSFDFNFSDPTLSYLFCGSITIFLGYIGLRELYESGQRRHVLAILAALSLALGFSLGRGSLIHYCICLIFPPLGFMQHNYYGLKVFYLIAAGCCVLGVKAIIEEKVIGVKKGFFFALSVGLIGAAMLYNYTADNYPLFLATSFPEVLLRDLIFFILINCFVALLLWYALKKRITYGFAARLLSVIVILDLLIPPLGKYFLPSFKQSASYSDYSGILQPVSPYAAFFKRELELADKASFRPLRFLAEGIDPWSNQLFPIGMSSLVTHDSQGIRDFQRQYRFYRENKLTFVQLAEEYGIDYYWKNDGNSLAGLLQDSLRKVFTDPSFGNIFALEFDKSRVMTKNNDRLLLSWFPKPGVIRSENNRFSRRWLFNIPREEFSCDEFARLSLPFMWLYNFSATDTLGATIPFYRDSFGRIEVPCDERVLKMSLEYPSQAVQMATVTSLAVRAIVVSLFLFFGSIWIYRRFKTMVS